MIVALHFGNDVVNVIQSATLPVVRPDSGFDSAHDVTNRVPAVRVHDTYDADNDVYVHRVPFVAVVNMTQAKAACKSAINASLDKYQSQFVTPAYGKPFVYLRKEAEARALRTMLDAQQDPYSDANWAQFPYIGRDAIAKNITRPVAFALVWGQVIAWNEILERTEEKHQGLMGIVDAAQTVDTLPSTTVNWGTPW